MTITYLIGIGSNLPQNGLSGQALLQSVVAELADKTSLPPVRSSWFRSPAYPPGSGPDFVNGAVRADSDLPPKKFLAFLHELEAKHGRERAKRWGPRTLDLDLLAAGDRISPDTETWRHWFSLPHERQIADAPQDLVLPHPRLQDRAFVLIPLMEIAPDWRHPVLGKTVTELHAELTAEDLDGVRPIKDSGCQ